MKMPRPHRQRAYTLIEAVVALSVTGILLTGIGSSILLAGRALPEANNPLRASIAAASVADDISTELLTAVTVTENTATALTFTVADRDGDTVNETIRYIWSGVAGGPLTRAYNGGGAVTVLDNVTEFSLAYTAKVDAASTQPATETTLPFTTIIDIPLDSGSPEQNFSVTTTNYCGQYFAPDPAMLPANTVRWKVDRVYFRAMATGRTNGVTAVQLRAANPDRTPASTVIEQMTMDEKTLDSKTWTVKFFDFTASPWMTPTEGICIVLLPSANDQTAVILHQMTLASSAYASFLESTNGGATFTADSTNAMTLFTVYATVVTSTGGTTATTRLCNVLIAVNASESEIGRVETNAAVFNLPKVTLP